MRKFGEGKKMEGRGRMRWVVMIVLLLAGVAQAQSGLSPAMQDGVDRAAAEVLARTGVPSASVAVVRAGKVAYVKAYGRARLEPEMPAAPAMQYSIGSVSKQFTAALVLLLQQDGKLRLDDTVGMYLPALTRSNEVTIRQVLSMTSGYQDFWPEDYVMTSMMVPTTPDHILDVWGRKPLDFEPGTKWQYSNTNYVIAGQIAEMVGGKTVVEQLQERIFGPLGMAGVLDSDASRLPAGDPMGYYRHALGPLRPAPQEGMGWMFAAGELAMPASALAAWNVSLMERSLLKPASYDEMFREQTLKDGTGTRYGLGVFVRTADGRAEIEHSGEVSGFVSENLVLPSEKIAVTVLTNEDASSAAGVLAKAIAGVVAADAGGSTKQVRAATKDGPVQTNAVAAGHGEDVAKATARTRSMLLELQKGMVDRKELTALCSDYFSQEALQDFKASLGPLGEPTSVEQVAESLRGGMRFRALDVSFANARVVRVTEYEMPDGRLEQFLAEAKGN